MKWLQKLHWKLLVSCQLMTCYSHPSFLIFFEIHVYLLGCLYLESWNIHKTCSFHLGAYKFMCYRDCGVIFLSIHVFISIMSNKKCLSKKEAWLEERIELATVQEKVENIRGWKGCHTHFIIKWVACIVLTCQSKNNWLHFFHF